MNLAKIYCERDEVAEWLRRWTANPMGSPRVSSNLILVVSFGVTELSTAKAFVAFQSFTSCHLSLTSSNSLHDFFLQSLSLLSRCVSPQPDRTGAVVISRGTGHQRPIRAAQTLDPSRVKHRPRWQKVDAVRPVTRRVLLSVRSVATGLSEINEHQ